MPPAMVHLTEGFALFEHAIEHIYVQRAKAARKLARVLISRKGKPQRLKRKKLDDRMKRYQDPAL
jgi:hypothetical protein